MKCAYVGGTRAIEVEEIAPLAGGADKRRAVVGDVVAHRAEVVVDDVEDDSETETMGLVDKRARSSGVPYSRDGANMSTPS